MTKRNFQIPIDKKIFLYALPMLILVFVFSYVPLYGWVLAFFNYKPGMPLTADRFVGFANFTEMFGDPISKGELIRVMKNTLGMSALGLVSSPIAVIFALFLVEIPSKKYQKFIQTFTTLPNFISWVLMFSITFAVFSLEDGFINHLLIALKVIDNPINFMGSSEHIWLKMWSISLYKGLGWSSIIYISALSSIDQEFYEAAKVDGANRFQLMWHISITALMPTFFVLLLLSIGNLINNGMEQYLVYANPLNRDTIEVLDLYVYNTGIKGVNYSYATAVGMMKSVISIILLFAANTFSKLTREESIF